MICWKQPSDWELGMPWEHWTHETETAFCKVRPGISEWQFCLLWPAAALWDLLHHPQPDPLDPGLFASVADAVPLNHCPFQAAINWARPLACQSWCAQLSRVSHHLWLDSFDGARSWIWSLMQRGCSATVSWTIFVCVELLYGPVFCGSGIFSGNHSTAGKD